MLAVVYYTVLSSELTGVLWAGDRLASVRSVCLVCSVGQLIWFVFGDSVREELEN